MLVPSLAGGRAKGHGPLLEFPGQLLLTGKFVCHANKAALHWHMLAVWAPGTGKLAYVYVKTFDFVLSWNIQGVSDYMALN